MAESGKFEKLDDQLIRLCGEWLKAKGGSPLVGGPTCIIQIPGSPESNFYVAVYMFGRKPPEQKVDDGSFWAGEAPRGEDQVNAAVQKCAQEACPQCNLGNVPIETPARWEHILSHGQHVYCDANRIRKAFPDAFKELPSPPKEQP